MPRMRQQAVMTRPGAQSVCEVTAEGGDRNVGKEIGIVDGGCVRSGEPQVADHFRQDHAVAYADGVIDEQIDKDGCENDPGPVKTPSIFRRAYRISLCNRPDTGGKSFEDFILMKSSKSNPISDNPRKQRALC